MENFDRIKKKPKTTAKIPTIELKNADERVLKPKPESPLSQLDLLKKELRDEFLKRLNEKSIMID